MAILRRRRARPIRYNSAPCPVESDITLWDHVRLLEMLKSKPGYVLEQFRIVGVWCLAELAMFRRLWITDRPAALRIAAVAKAMSIPVDAVDALDLREAAA